MSIRLRLTLYWASVLAIILVIGAVSIFGIFRRQQWAAVDAALMEEADTGAAAIAHLEEPAADAILRRLSQERDIGPGRRIRLVAGNKVVADFGNRDSDLPPAGIRGGIFDGLRSVYRFAVVPLAFGGRDAVLEDGVDAIHVRSSIARLKAIVSVVTPLLLLGCVVGGYWLAGRTLAPIAALAAALARIEPGELSERLPAGTTGDEIARLAHSINALLDRLQTASLTERRFISDAAHELRTPLTVLRTGLEVTLNRARGVREQHEALQSALHDVVALCTMADELLAMARLSGESFAQRVPLSLRALIGEVLETVEPLTQAKNLNVRVNGADDLCVEANPQHLKRLLINLTDNSIKFTPQSGTIAVTLERGGKRAIIRVADSGPGIAPADLPFIFERFFRGGGPKTNGSGLGLSLCREIVRLHHGEITARNIPGQGCEFAVALPLADTAASSAA